MNATGSITSIQRDWKTNKLNITFQVNEEPTEEINDLVQCEKLSIEVKKFRKKRSLDANGLLWACLGEIAAENRTDKWSVYLQMLRQYGKFTYICVKPNVVDAVKAQWRECEVIGEVDINGTTAVQMLCYFGSSTYDSKEFSVLLDGVVSEMKDMGLSIPPSKDVQKALEAWERQHG